MPPIIATSVTWNVYRSPLARNSQLLVMTLKSNALTSRPLLPARRDVAGHAHLRLDERHDAVHRERDDEVDRSDDQRDLEHLVRLLDDLLVLEVELEHADRV